MERFPQNVSNIFLFSLTMFLDIGRKLSQSKGKNYKQLVKEEGGVSGKRQVSKHQ